MDEFGHLARDYGAQVAAYLDNDEEIEQARVLARELKLGVDWYRTPAEPYSIAEAVRRYLAERQAGTVELHEHTGDPAAEARVLEESDRILLTRAFSDYRSIEVQALTGGLSGACVCRADALPEVGPRPIPFVVKLDRVEEIAEEYSRYNQFVRDGIPFHLRPNIDPVRSLRGSKRAILVGTFFDRCQSLLDVMSTRGAESAIHNLFEYTLEGWRSQGYEDGHSIEGPLFSAGNEDERFPASGFAPANITVARAHGLRSNPRRLLERAWALPPVRYRYAPIHGDLNVNNVFVRGGEAAVIDFRRVRQGPLVADVASLEVSMLVEYPRTERGEWPRNLSLAQWRAAVDHLFEIDFQEVPAPPSSPTSWACILGCVRQLRMIALSCSISDREYAHALVYYLLRRGARSVRGTAVRFRRAYCLVLAERLLDRLDAGN